MKFHFSSLPSKGLVFGVSAILSIFVVTLMGTGQVVKTGSKAQVAPAPPGTGACLGSACTVDADCHNICGYKQICANAGPVAPPAGGLCVLIVCDTTSGAGKCVAQIAGGAPSLSPTPMTITPISPPPISISPTTSVTPPTVTEASFTPASFTPPVPPATTVKICLDYFKCSDSDARIEGSILNGKVQMPTVVSATFISGKSICSNVKDLAEYTQFGKSAKMAMFDHCAAKARVTPTISIKPTNSPSCQPLIKCATKSIGDANCDGVVSVVDFEIFRSEINGEKSSCEANFDGVNGVDMNDYRAWYLTVQGIK